jgi:hypothetical protein
VRVAVKASSLRDPVRAIARMRADSGPTGCALMLDRPASRRDRQRSERKARWRDRQRRAVAVMNLDVALLQV